MSSAVMELIDIFAGEGAFIFVQRQGRSTPTFEVVTSAEIKACSTLYARRGSSNILLAMDDLYKNSDQLASMIQSIANDKTVSTVYVESVSLAHHLTLEAGKAVVAPFESEAGLLFAQIARKNV